MRSVAQTNSSRELNERLAGSGFRFTAQREQVYDILLGKRDHPTAEEVFLRAKQQMPEISMATVYNCLDTLVQCGLVRQVNLERGATRYFIDVVPQGLTLTLPRGFRVRHAEISIRGTCPECSANGGI